MRSPCVCRSAWGIALLALVLLPFASQAQHHGGGHGGGHGGFQGGHGSFHGGAVFHGSPAHFHGGPHPGRPVVVAPRRTFVAVGVGGWGWWGYPWWGYPWWWDDYRPYYRPYVYAPTYYAPSYIYDLYGGPIYYVSPDNSYVYESPPAVVPEDYSSPATGTVAQVIVRLPTEDAQVYFNGARMLAQGTTRQFTTPPLEPGHDYYYTVRARWRSGGQWVERQAELHVQPGQSYTLDFTRESSSSP